MEKIIKVNGMKCDKCAIRVANCLNSLENISNTNVDLNTKEVKIEYDNKIDLDLIEEKINDLGFNIEK